MNCGDHDELMAEYRRARNLAASGPFEVPEPPPAAPEIPPTPGAPT